jgi:uncharacterized membrane protein
MKLIGWLILLALLECLLMFAWLLPTPRPSQIVVSWVTGYVPIEKNMQWFAMFVAYPLCVLALLLIDHDDSDF